MKRMSLRTFGDLVARVMEALPPAFQPFLENLVVDVEDEPDVRTLRELGYTEAEVADGEMPYGLFCPFPMQLDAEADVEAIDADQHPFHRIIVYKRPLEEDFPDPRELRREIRKTVIHELAHHFGYSERDLDPFEAKEEPWDD